MAGRDANSVFQQPWWLEAVAPGRWDAVEVTSDRYGVDAWLPYAVRFERAGRKVIDMPALTPTLGPWVRPSPSSSPRKVLAHHMTLLGRLVDALPPADLFRQNLHHSLPTALPFAQQGFTLTVGYTYVIDDVSSPEALWARISTSRRQDIQKAQRNLEVVPSDDLDLFLHLNRLTFQRQGINPRYDDEYVRRLDEACRRHDASQILIAFDKAGNAHGAHYLVFDQSTTYGLMSGLDPAHRRSNAGSLLMWEALRFASSVSTSFNFSGGTIRGVEPFIASFGGRQVPYVTATRASLGWRSAELVRDTFRSARPRSVLARISR